MTPTESTSDLTDTHRLATDGGVVSDDPTRDPDDPAVEERLVNFLAYATSQVNADDPAVDQALEAIDDTIEELVDDDDVSFLAVITALYIIILDAESSMRQ